jgi:hypothetical protein
LHSEGWPSSAPLSPAQLVEDQLDRPAGVVSRRYGILRCGDVLGGRDDSGQENPG